jgi:hypothetical protein
MHEMKGQQEQRLTLFSGLEERNSRSARLWVRLCTRQSGREQQRSRFPSHNYVAGRVWLKRDARAHVTKPSLIFPFMARTRHKAKKVVGERAQRVSMMSLVQEVVDVPEAAPVQEAPEVAPRSGNDPVSLEINNSRG